MNEDRKTAVVAGQSETPCYVCGADPATGRLARLLGHRPDIAYMKLRKAEKVLQEIADLPGDRIDEACYLALNFIDKELN